MQLIYVYDALCGWCYGFSPVMEAFAKRHADDFDVEVVSGGMIVGEREGPIGEVAPYIKWAYKEVENKTGVKFGTGFLEGILEPGTAEFSSIPPALALSVFKTHLPDQALAFAARLQKAVYYDGLAPKDWAGYGPLAAEFGLDGDAFVQQLQEPRFMELAQRDFQRAQTLGVQGFPTIFLERDGQYHRLGSGYMPLEQLEARYQSVLAR